MKTTTTTCRRGDMPDGDLYTRRDKMQDQGGGGVGWGPKTEHPRWVWLVCLLACLAQLPGPATPLKSSSSKYSPTSIPSSSSPSSSSSSSSTFHDPSTIHKGQVSSSSSSSPSGLPDQRWHVASTFLGGEIQLPCAVDVAGCGRIYFITWTKNVSDSSSSSSGPNSAGSSRPAAAMALSTSPAAQSASGAMDKSGKSAANGDWQRVYIYSDSMQRVLGDLAQYGPEGRVSFGPRDLNQSIYAFLSIKQLQAEDEGVYKCDVTYTTPHAHGKCPSLTYTRVQTLVKPSSPIIRVNGRPLSDYRQDSSQAAESLASTGSTTPKGNDVELLRHRQIGPFAEGSTIVFECSTFGGRPMPQLRWYNGSRPLRSKISVEDSASGDAGLEVDQTTGNELDDNNLLFGMLNAADEEGPSTSSLARKKVTATARIMATRYDLGAKFECRVVWNNSDGSISETGRPKGSKTEESSVLFDWLLLDIKVRPLSIRVATPRAPVVAGETVALRCTVDGARPAANITWYNRSEVVEAVAMPTNMPALNLANSLSFLNSAVAAEDGGGGGGDKSSQQQQSPRERFTVELMSDGTYRSTSILVFQATRHDHMSEFYCKGSNEVSRSRNEVPLLQGERLQVLYPPAVAIEPDGLIPVNESSTMQLWCTYDANPANLTEVRWYKDGVPIDFAQWSAEKLWMGKDERGTPILTVNDIDRNDSAEYKCRVRNAFGATESSTTAKLEVAYPPAVRLEILEPSNSIIVENIGSSNNNNNNNNMLRMRCETVMGNPTQLISVHWHRNGRHFLTTNSLKMLKPAHHQSIATAGGGGGQGGATVQTGRHFYRLGQGKHFTLVDESMPVGPFDGAVFSADDEERQSSDWEGLVGEDSMQQPFVSYLEQPDVISITNISRVNAGNYSCIGFNGAANSSQPSKAKPLYVKYAPGPAELTLTSVDDYVVHGQRAVLECRIKNVGNPRAHTILWTHNGRRIDRPNVIALSPPPSDNGLEQGFIVRYRSAPADRSISGEYGCAAQNELGEGPWGKFNLQVRAPPKLLQGLPTTIGSLVNSSLSLTCRVECEPICQIRWFHNNLTALTPDGPGVLASPIRNELRAKLRNGNELAFWTEIVEHHQDYLDNTAETRKPAAAPVAGDSVYSHTTSKLHIFNSSALFDHDHLTCMSVGNERIGSAVSSTVIFRREYPPHSVHISMPQIDLLEGERYPEKPVQCSAFANPPPTYYWTFNPSAVATEMATGGKHRVGGQGSPATYEEIDGQTIVGMGPRLMLNMSTMSATIGQGGGNLDGNYNYMKQLSLEEVAKSNARIAHEQQTSIGSTVGPSLFRASRMQSGNYTCVARNKHGVVTVTMAINVFFRPECQLHRMHTAKLFVQPNRNESHHQHSQHSSRPGGQVLIACQARANPAPLQFSWFRRNGTQLLEIHPSTDAGHRVIVAQDYDYEETSNVVGGGEDYGRPASAVAVSPPGNFQAEQSAANDAGHVRQSAVLSVPEFASLEEYACVVTNHIGQSEPCWYQEVAAGSVSQEPTNWSLLGGEDSLTLVAATLGLFVFIVIAIGGVTIAVCMHYHRSPSFKGLGSSRRTGGIGGGSDHLGGGIGGASPHRFKLDHHNRRPHHLLDSSPDMEDFLVDNRSKTATLTAAYRMHASGGTLGPGGVLIGPPQHQPGGTLSKSYKSLHHHNQNTYMSAGSVYGGSSSGGGGSSSGNGSRPFLVSYASSNVYAEPEYGHNNGHNNNSSSNHSGDQLTGSTTVTTNDGSNNEIGGNKSSTNEHHLLALLGRNGAVVGGGAYARHTEGDANDSDHARAALYENNYNSNSQNYATYEELDNINAGMLLSAPKGGSGRKGGHIKSNHSSPGSVVSEGDQLAEFEKAQSRQANNKPEPIESDHESEELGRSRESLSASSNAYNPERDFYYDIGGAGPPMYAAADYTGNSGRRMWPAGGPPMAVPGNQFGSLMRQQQAASGPHNAAADLGPAGATLGRQHYQQYRQSPQSTRLYFNFNDGASPYQSSPYNHHNNLRLNGAAGSWLPSSGRRRASSPSNGPHRLPRDLDSPSSAHPMRTFNTNASGGRVEYHRVYNNNEQ